jgi:transcriptional regulator with XRE-family HTH domain
MTSGDEKELPAGWELPPAKNWEEALHHADITRKRALDNFTAVAEMAFRNGDKKALPLILIIYLGWRLLPPRWAIEEIMKALNPDTNPDIRSWDDIFGKPFVSKDKKSLMGEKAYREGERLRKQHGYKRADDSDLFPELGKVLGVSANTAKRYYYSKSKQEIEEVLALAAELGIPEDKADRDPFVSMIHQTKMLNRMTESAQNKVRRKLQTKRRELETLLKKPAQK